MKQRIETAKTQIAKTKSIYDFKNPHLRFEGNRLHFGPEPIHFLDLPEGVNILSLSEPKEGELLIETDKGQFIIYNYLDVNTMFLRGVSPEAKQIFKQYSMKMREILLCGGSVA